jgi:hypothetical protein
MARGGGGNNETVKPNQTPASQSCPALRALFSFVLYPGSRLNFFDFRFSLSRSSVQRLVLPIMYTSKQ